MTSKNFLIILVILFFTSCSTVRVRHTAKVITKDGATLKTVYKESYPISNQALQCGLSFIFFGGFCWKYLQMPREEHKTDVKKGILPILTKIFGKNKFKVIRSSIKRISWEDKNPEHRIFLLKDPKLAKQRALKNTDKIEIGFHQKQVKKIIGLPNKTRKNNNLETWQYELFKTPKLSSSFIPYIVEFEKNWVVKYGINLKEKEKRSKQLKENKGPTREMIEDLKIKTKFLQLKYRNEEIQRQKKLQWLYKKSKKK